MKFQAPWWAGLKEHFKNMCVCTRVHVCVHFSVSCNSSIQLASQLTKRPSPRPSQARKSQRRLEGVGCHWTVFDRSLKG